MNRHQNQDNHSLFFVLTGTIEPQERLDVSIAKNWPEHFSRTEAQRLITEGMVTIDQVKVIKPSFKTKHPIDFSLKARKTPKFTLKPNNQNVPVLYQDGDLAVIHKPPQMTVHPGSGTKEDTLVHSLKAQIQPLSDLNSEERPGIIHRLDRDTEGIMLIAKNNTVHRKLSEQFQARTIYKEYHAWLHGVLNPPKGKINGFISRNPFNRKLMLFKSEETLPHSRRASLCYETIKVNHQFSLAKIVLKTGRTHQIRCSFPHINAHIVGDTLYSSRKTRQKAFDQKFGLLLVANRVRFHHPTQDKEFEFHIELPQLFLEFEQKYFYA